MRRIRVGVAVCLVLLMTPPARALSAEPAVELDRTTMAVTAGEEFSFTSTVSNRGSTPVAGLLAHLAITSLDAETYVDPEDWSSERTQYLALLAPGGAVISTWHMKAVGSGRFVVYVAVSAGTQGTAVNASPTLRLDVASRRTLNPGSVVPVAVGVPAVVAVLMALLAHRRRRIR